MRLEAFLLKIMATPLNWNHWNVSKQPKEKKEKSAFHSCLGFNSTISITAKKRVNLHSQLSCVIVLDEKAVAVHQVLFCLKSRKSFLPQGGNQTQWNKQFPNVTGSTLSQLISNTYLQHPSCSVCMTKRENQKPQIEYQDINGWYHEETFFGVVSWQRLSVGS